MVPAAFVMLDSLPLTANGKINRRALPAPTSVLQSKEGMVGPRTPVEEQLIEIWCKVLGLKQDQLGIHETFFELGGHSLLATQVMSRVRNTFQIELPVRSLFEAPTVAQLAEQIEMSRQMVREMQAPTTAQATDREQNRTMSITRQMGQADLLDFLSNSNGYAPTPMQPVAREGDLPLSFAQQRIWFLEQLEGESATHNMPAALRLAGKLNIAALQKSINEMVSRHEALRTSFPVVNGVPHQAIAPDLQVPLPILELGAEGEYVSKEAQQAEVQRLAAEEAKRLFDLVNGPLLRVKLLRLAEEEHVLLITMHHIISDGWSIGVFVREWGALYKAYLEGAPSPLKELAIQYIDFAHWQQKTLQGEKLDKLLTYWRTQLADAPPLLELPTDYLRPAVQSLRGGREILKLDPSLMERVKKLSQACGTTDFMTALAVFGVLLSRMTGEEDLLIGCPIANRNRHEIENLIGCFINTLVMRIDLSGNPTFLELLEQVKQTALDGFAQQDLPFEKLVEALQPTRNMSHAPLFQVMFVLQNTPIGELLLPGLKITELKSKHVTADFDLTLFMSNDELGFHCTWEYSTDLFKRSTIERMMGHFHQLLKAVTVDPSQRVQNLPLLTEQEEHQLLVEWNKSETRLPAEGTLCFHQLFEQQVEKTPDAVAARFDGQALTYRELNAQANQLASFLVDKGVGPDVVVALLMERSLDFLIAVIAIFKAGGAYLPLNPHAPAKRHAQVVRQSQTPLLLTERASSDDFSRSSPPKTLNVLFIEELQEEVSNRSEENLPPRCTPDDLAYVIYTSGSTGLPKGAMVEQKGMLNHLYAKIWDLSLTQKDRIAQTAPQSFDISVWQFLSALLVGGEVHIFKDEMAGDPARLLQEVEQQAISILEVVPSLLRMMLKELDDMPEGSKPALANLRWFIPTGEALPPPLCREWFDYYPEIFMVNAYGPTECSDDVTHYVITEAPDETVVNMPIGRPVANMRLYILDAQLQPVPIGVAGELYVGGIGVGRGYLHDPERTAKAFIPVEPTSPLCLAGAEAQGARLYKTGDKARYLPNTQGAGAGVIEFLGRLDYQVKIRGFRIELGEIEAILGSHANVAQAAVIVRDIQPAGKTLIAYVLLNQEEVSTNTLRRYLSDRLPDYMVPALFIILDAMPLTPNGKVNRRALQDKPLPEMNLSTKHIAPRNAIESQVASIWARVMEQEETQIGVLTNFFELGGHSLLATQIMSRVHKTFQLKLSLQKFFEQPTVAGLAELIERHQLVRELEPSSNGTGTSPSGERVEIEL